MKRQTIEQEIQKIKDNPNLLHEKNKEIISKATNIITQDGIMKHGKLQPLNNDPRPLHLRNQQVSLFSNIQNSLIYRKGLELETKSLIIQTKTSAHQILKETLKMKTKKTSN